MGFTRVLILKRLHSAYVSLFFFLSTCLYFSIPRNFDFTFNPFGAVKLMRTRIRLPKRRGAEVIALSSVAKAEEVRALGADQVLDRNVDLVAELGTGSIDVVIDLVAGEQWPSFLDVLRRGGRYATAGAIAGPIAQIDVRTLYLKDLTLMGCTFQEDEVFANLISYIEAGEIRPVVAKTYPLRDIAQAQEDFLVKKHTGKLVLIPPEVSS